MLIQNKNLYTLIRQLATITLFVCTLASCLSRSPDNLKPLADPSIITESLKNWLVYNRDYIDWDSKYTSFDEYGNKIDKGRFLSELTLGIYLPLRVQSEDSAIAYKLHKLNLKEQAELGDIIKNLAETQYHFYTMEGKPLPGFDFTDIRGNTYTAANSPGKAIVLNCWYIHCLNCVKEIPDLNNLVDEYGGKDVIFLGLAFDPLEDLQIFLKKMEFKYNIVAQKEKYLLDTLKIPGYPTHILIGKDGKVASVTNDLEVVKKFLKKTQE